MLYAVLHNIFILQACGRVAKWLLLRLRNQPISFAPIQCYHKNMRACPVRIICVNVTFFVSYGPPATVGCWWAIAQLIGAAWHICNGITENFIHLLMTAMLPNDKRYAIHDLKSEAVCTIQGWHMDNNPNLRLTLPPHLMPFSVVVTLQALAITAVY